MQAFPSHMLRLVGRSLAPLMIIGAFLLSACGSSSQAGGKITIVLEGPNQWNTSGTSFGPGWDTAVQQFEQLNPNITLKINVLPLNSFYQTESTQLAAGTAPDLVFNQATYKGYQVVSLDSYLNQPNPYAPERGKWIDWFDSRAYGFSTADSLTPVNDGHLYWVPFNLISAGLYYNVDAFNKAGITSFPKTWEDLRTAFTKLKAAGYAPIAMDNSNLGVLWTFQMISNQLLAKYYDKLNTFDTTGNPGTNSTLTLKDYVRAIKTGAITTKVPEIEESLKLYKEVFDNATPNWSGVQGLSGSGVGLPDFVAGKAAMAWGVNFGASDVSKATFKVGSTGWPTITTDTTPLSTNAPAQWGISTGGTSYMIPSTTKGDHLTYAIKFLQFITAPKYAQDWITTTTGVPSVQTVNAPDVINGFSQGDWGTPRRQNSPAISEGSPQLSKDFVQLMQGYLIGSVSLADTESQLQTAWNSLVTYELQQNPTWTSESWAK